MLAKHVTEYDLEKALTEVNRQFDGNIEFKQINQQGKNVRFTLTVRSSYGKGARLGFVHNGKQRHIKAACWHAHGEFFDALFSVASDAVIISQGNKITKDAGNWDDKNIRSNYSPFFFSEACNCGKEN
jgi:hypothetical protein